MIIQNLSELALKSDKFYLYGSGSLGVYVLNRFLNEYPDIEIIAFIDDSKIGKLNGINIIKLDEINNSIPIIITSSYWENMSDNLKSLGSEYYIADLLNFERESKITHYSKDRIKLSFFTPNQFLFEVINNIEIIEPKTLDWINNLNGKVV